MVDRFPEALTLVQRGGLYYRQAQTLLQSVDVEDHKDVKDSSTSVILENLQSELPSVQAALEKAEVRASKDWYFHRLGPSEDLQAAASVETAVESLTLTAPTLKDKKRKRAKPGPTFYDVAFSYIAPVAIVDTNVPNKSATTLDPASVQKDVVPSDAADTTLMNAEAPQSDPPASSTSGRGLWGLFGRRR